MNDLACKVELLVVKVRSIQVLSEEWRKTKERERRRGRIEEEGKEVIKGEGNMKK